MLEIECYQILRVSESASFEEIKQAYRRHVQLYHPDVRRWDKNSNARFQKIASAYRVLSEKKRQTKPARPLPKKNLPVFNFTFAAQSIFTPTTSSPVGVNTAPKPLELATAELIMRFQGTENVFVRREVIKALRHKKDADALRLLTKTLKSTDGELRRLAVQSIAYYQEPLAVYLIASLLGDPDIRVRYEAIDALGLQTNPRAKVILERLTTDKSFFTRERAQKALGKL